MTSEPSNTILIEDISIYQGPHLILDQVDFQAITGDFIYLIGKTGSGKSSFLKALYAGIPVKGKTMEIAGFSLLGISDKKIPFLRRKVGMIFQDFQLLTDRNIFDNMDFVLSATGWKNKEEKHLRIQEVLNMVGMQTKGFKMPHELSGGEQQRAVIARALLNKPPVILADEPTANLDPQLTLEILDLLQEISRQGTTVLMSTHDYTLIQKKPGRVLLFDHHKVSEITPEEL